MYNTTISINNVDVNDKTTHTITTTSKRQSSNRIKTRRKYLINNKK